MTKNSTNLYFTVKWDTSLSQEVRNHKITVKLHKCFDGAKARDSIQIKCPNNITLDDAQKVCIEDSAFNDCIQYIPYKNSLSIKRPNSSTYTQDTLTFQIGFRETKKLDQMEGTYLYILEHNLKPFPNNFSHKLQLPRYRWEWLRRLTNTIACAMKRQGAYYIFDLSGQGDIDAKDGEIIYRYTGVDRPRSFSYDTGILYGKAYRMNLVTMIFGIVIGCLGSLLSFFVLWIGS